MPTLQTARGKDFLPDLAGALSRGVTGFQEQKARQRTEDLFQEKIKATDTLADPNSTKEEKNAASIRMASIDPKSSKAMQDVLKTNDDRLIAKTKREIEQGTTNAIFVNEGKDVAEMRRRWRVVRNRRIDQGNDSPEDEKIAALGDDEFVLRMKLMETKGTDMATLLKDTFTEIPGTGTQRNDRTQKIEAIPGSVTAQAKLVASLNTKAVKTGNQTQLMQFNTDTGAFDIPVGGATFTSQGVVKFNKDGFEVTQRMNPKTGKMETIATNALKPTEPKSDIAIARAEHKAGLINDADLERVTNAIPKFQGDVGQAVGDLARGRRLFPEGSEQLKALEEAVTDAETGASDIKLTDIGGVRKEFTKASGEYIKVRDAINRIRSTDASGPGDLALIFNFMKMLDPGSTVREGEFANAENSQGISEKLRNTYNKIVDGTRLTPKARLKFIGQAERLFKPATDTQVQLETSFRKLAGHLKMDPEKIIIDFKPEVAASREVTDPESVVVPSGAPPGTQFTGTRDRDGNPVFELKDGRFFSLKPKKK